MNKAIKYTLITVGIDLLIAILIFLWILAPFEHPFRDFFEFISHYPLNFGLGILFLIISSYYVGKKMQTLICEKKWNSILVGMLGLMLILIFGTFGGTTVGFIEGLKSGDTTYEAIVDYYGKPFFFILMFGFIPTFISGGILGVIIRKKTTYNTV